METGGLCGLLYFRNWFFCGLVTLYRTDFDGNYCSSASDPGTWFTLITAYSIGFALPFFLLAFFLGGVKRILKYSNLLMKIGGVLMVFMGILLFTDQMFRITVWLQGITPDWLIF